MSKPKIITNDDLIKMLPEDEQKQIHAEAEAIILEYKGRGANVRIAEDHALQQKY